MDQVAHTERADEMGCVTGESVGITIPQSLVLRADVVIQ
jgi:hypothetical protein